MRPMLRCPIDTASSLPWVRRKCARCITDVCVLLAMVDKVDRGSVDALCPDCAEERLDEMWRAAIYLELAREGLFRHIDAHFERFARLYPTGQR